MRGGWLVPAGRREEGMATRGAVGVAEGGRTLAHLIVPVVLGLATGCATARNYEDPGAPVFVGGRATASEAPDLARRTLRVVTFNLKWGRHVERAADLLSRSGPLRSADLLVLQEMDRPGTERLAEALGLAYVYVPSAVHPVPQQDFGVALLSPWPLDAPGKLLLPHHARFRGLRRSAAVATLRSPLGPVRVYGVHLESPTGGGGGVRRDQARALVADARAWAGPVVVAGDFNGTSGPREMASAGYQWITEEVTNTAGPFDLDHVVARGLCSGAAPATGRADDLTKASDHHPVWAVLAPCEGKAASGQPEPAW